MNFRFWQKFSLFANKSGDGNINCLHSNDKISKMDGIQIRDKSIKTIYRDESEIQKGNRLIVVHGDGTEEEVSSFPKLDLSFKGEYALIKIHDDIVITDSLKLVTGTGTYAEFSNKVRSEKAIFYLQSFNCTLFVGKKTTLRNVKLYAGSDGKNLEIFIGEDCMFSFNVILRPTDVHTIFSLDNNKMPINRALMGIRIGDHCWIGQNAIITRDAVIPNNCIVGAGAVVTRRKFVDNCIIAGNPASIIKKNVGWDRMGIENFIKKYQNGN